MSLAAAKAAATANWPLDEASGNAIDSVGANDGTETSGTIGSASGVFGNARDFEAGDTEWFAVADHADISMGNIDFCIVFWAKPETVDSNLRYAVCKGDSATATQIPYGVAIEANRFRLLVGDGGSNFTVVYQSGTISAGNTYLVVAKHDSVNNVVGVSINGGAYNEAPCTHGSFNDTA